MPHVKRKGVLTTVVQEVIQQARLADARVACRMSSERSASTGFQRRRWLSAGSDGSLTDDNELEKIICRTGSVSAL